MASENNVLFEYFELQRRAN